MSEIVIAGNTSGSVTIAAPDVAGTTTLTLPASSGTVLDDASVGVCRAWVNFNGTGTVAIRAAFNVSSITDNGVSKYTINFANAMPDANYAVTGTCHSPAVASGAVQAPSTSSANQTAAGVMVSAVTMQDVGFDAAFVQVAIFR